VRITSEVVENTDELSFGEGQVLPMTCAELQNPAERPAAIVAAGVAAYEASLPPSLRPEGLTEMAPSRVNLALSDERQREICLSCPLADCLGIESPECPIRIEQRAERRSRRRGRDLDDMAD